MTNVVAIREPEFEMHLHGEGAEVFSVVGTKAELVELLTGMINQVMEL